MTTTTARISHLVREQAFSRKTFNRHDGTLYAVVAYTLWGILPIYWKAVQMVPAREIICHRMIWSFVFTVIILVIKRRWHWLQTACKNMKTIVTFIGTAIILTLNWLTYIWAVNSGYILEASLGYFINPLVSVVLGMVFLGERLRFWQWLAIGIAATGVLYLTIKYGAFPWIGLTLAFTFGFYGLLRKTASLSALEGFASETAIMFLPALFYLLYLEFIGTGSFGHVSLLTSVLLGFAGVVTALPLLLFAVAARKITLTLVGLLQYITPTLQFLVGVLLYGESFTRTRMIGFGIIWLALVVYSVEGILKARGNVRMPF